MSPNLSPLIKEMSCGPRWTRHLDEETACALFAAILSDEVHETERNAVLAALCRKDASLGEMRGVMRALDAHVARLEAPADRPRPVILATSGGTRRGPNLTALLALLLRRYGVPVLAHGTDAATASTASAARFGRVTTLAILLELGIEPAPGLRNAQARLAQHQIAYVRTAVLVPSLAPLLDYHSPSGIRSFAHSLLRLIDPFGGDGYRVVSVKPGADLRRTREFLAATRANALLLSGTEGEPCTNPHRPSQLEAFANGSASICAEAESGEPGEMTEMPATNDAPATAAWISRILAGESAVPASVIGQLACCLEGARRSAGAS